MPPLRVDYLTGRTDLTFGHPGLGQDTYCYQGNSYTGPQGLVCGLDGFGSKNSNVDMEVWFRVGS